MQLVCQGNNLLEYIIEGSKFCEPVLLDIYKELFKLKM